MNILLRRRARAGLCTAILFGALAAQAAGTVDVRFVEPARFADAGFGEQAIAHTQKVLGEHLRALGQRLPDGTELRIDVLDVDLAGTPERHRYGDLRVLRGRADPPMLRIGWSLLEGGRTVKSGEERLTELDYLRHAGRLSPPGDLPHERALLDRWFAERFAPAA